jgi:hypothetical protein
MLPAALFALLPHSGFVLARYPDTISPARMTLQVTCRNNVGFSLAPLPLVAYLFHPVDHLRLQRISLQAI